MRAFTLFSTHYFELTSLPELCPTMANVHLDATEHQDHVVFLHNIQEGPANRSFGLQVAKLAGIPAPVLDAARDKLRELEQGELAGGQAGKHRAPAQVDLFSAPPAPGADRPRGPDVDGLTPREALQKLYELKAGWAEKPFKFPPCEGKLSPSPGVLVGRPWTGGPGTRGTFQEALFE